MNRAADALISLWGHGDKVDHYVYSTKKVVTSAQSLGRIIIRVQFGGKMVIELLFYLRQVMVD